MNKGIADIIRKETDKLAKLQGSDPNKNIIFREDVDGSKRYIRPGEVDNKDKTVIKTKLGIEVLDVDPVVLKEGMIWVRRDLI